MSNTQHLKSFTSRAALAAHLKAEHPEFGRLVDGTESLAHLQGNHEYAHNGPPNGTPGPARLAAHFRVAR